MKRLSTFINSCLKAPMAWLRDNKLTVVFLLAMALSMHSYAITVISGNVVVSGHFNDVTGIKVLSTANVNNAVGGNISYTGTLEIQGNPTFTNSGTMNYVAGNTLLYSGSAQRTSANEWTTSASALNVTINNTGGVVLAVASTINGLTLTQGILQIGNFNLTANTLTGGSSTSYVADNGTGVLTLNTVGASKTFPIGPTTTDYTPLTFSNVTLTPNISVGVGTTVSNTSTLTGYPNIVKLQWSVKSSQTISPNVTYQFNTSDFSSTFVITQAIQLAKYLSPSWTYAPIVPLTNTTTSPFDATVNGVTFNSGSTYNCVLGNNSVTRCTITSATLTSNPTITTGLCSGTSVTFTATAGVGTTAPASYQWWEVDPGYPDQAITGATKSTFVLPSVSTADNGVYYCVISNCWGSMPTGQGTLTVIKGANGTTPASTVVVSGGTVVLSTTSTGGNAFTYQWYNGSTPISSVGNYSIGSTTPTTYTEVSTLTVTNVTATTTFKAVVTNTCGSYTTGIATITVISGYVWTGATSTAWETPSNWSINLVPTILTDASIPQATRLPIVTSNSAACKNLMIYPGSSVTVNGSLHVGASLTISPLASVTVNSSPGALVVTGNLLIQSSSAGSGAVLDNNATSHVTYLTSTIQKYLGPILNAYYYVGSPFQTSTINNFTGFTPSGLNSVVRWYDPNVSPSPYPNILEYDEHHTHNLAYDYNGWRIPIAGETMVPMNGYSPYFAVTTLISLSSTSTANHFITGDQVLNTYVYANSTDTKHDGKGLDEYGDLCSSCPIAAGPTNGQYIVSNPYPTPVNLLSVLNNPINLNETNLLAQFDYWVPTGANGVGKYTYFNNITGSVNGGSQYLPVLGAAMIVDDNTNGSDNTTTLTMTNLDRSVSQAALTYNSNSKADKNSDLQLIRLSINMANNAEKYDEAVILFSADAKLAINHKFDGVKQKNTDPEYANLYSVFSNRDFVVKSYPEITNNLIVPLGVSVNTDGNYTINATQINNLPNGVHAYLVDTKNKVTQDLTQKASYNFDINGGDDSRFYLKFADALNATPELCYIYSSNKDLFVNYNNPDNNQASLKIYTVTGDLVTDRVSLSNGTYHTTLNVAPGIYLVKVISTTNVYVQKVYIQ